MASHRISHPSDVLHVQVVCIGMFCQCRKRKSRDAINQKEKCESLHRNQNTLVGKEDKNEKSKSEPNEPSTAEPAS